MGPRSGWSLSPDEGPPSFLPSPLTTKAGAETHSAPHSILLVEDNAADVNLVREALEEHEVRYQLSVVEDGERAMRLIEVMGESATLPELVVLDLNLPKRSGREVLQSLKANPRLRDTPVVILSSSQVEKDRTEMAALGASMFISKPSNLEEFMRIGGILKALLQRGVSQA